MTPESEARRRTLYRWAIGLSVIYLADGAFFAWALIEGGYAPLGYAQVFGAPVFIPAFLAGLIVSRLYWQGVTQRGWTVRKAEWLFFFLFFASVAAKAIVSIYDRVR
jgi:hypothetical protein